MLTEAVRVQGGAQVSPGDVFDPETYSKLLGLAKHVLKKEDCSRRLDAVDLAGEVLLRLVRISRARPGARDPDWRRLGFLRAVVFNVLRRAWREEGRVAFVADPDFVPEARDPGTCEDPPAWERLETARRACDALLESLVPPATALQVRIWRERLAGATWSEIAANVNHTEGAVRICHHRLLQRLQREAQRAQGQASRRVTEEDAALGTPRQHRPEGP